jgi:lycopene beta-cyclase
VLVVGAGPAGWAIAWRCAERGLTTVVVDPRPYGPWRATYGLWADQCAAALPAGSAVVESAMWAGGRRLARRYAVLDNDSVVAAYRGTGVSAIADRVVSAHCGFDDVTTVRLGSGRTVLAGLAIDASGSRRVLSGGRAPGERVEQTAFGLLLPAAAAAPVVSAGEGDFMRWDMADPAPTFLYAVPLPGGRVLLEETSLARRPGMAVGELRAKLTRRLAAAGVEPAPGGATEVVRFAVDLPLPRRRRGVVAFGVAAGMMHPATGYSVGDSLVTAPTVADVIADTFPRGGPAAAKAAHAAVWPPAARVVRLARLAGLRGLLALPPTRVPEFFDLFFALPEELQRAYLSGRADLPGTTAAMTAMFRAAPAGLRRPMALGWLRR